MILLFSASNKSGAPLRDTSFRTALITCPLILIMTMMLTIRDNGSIAETLVF